MFSATGITQAHLSHYYSKDDYYFRGGKESAIEHGTLAEKLQFMEGNIDPVEVFDGITGDRKSPATDLCFSAPKSLSLQMFLGDEKQRQDIINAHNQAVKKALEYIEKEGFVRVQKKEHGTVKKYPTEGILCLSINHSLSREKEPDLHSHALLANLGKILGEDRLRSVDLRQIYMNQKHIDQVYKSVMRQQLQGLGYQTRTTEHGFELAEISREQIEEFSTAKNNLDTALEEIGSSREEATGEERQRINQAIRSNKDEEIGEAELRADLQARAEAVGLTFEEPNPDQVKQPSDQEIRNLVNEGLADCLGSNTTITRRQATGHILQFANDQDQAITIDDIRKHLPVALEANEMLRLPGQTAGQGDHHQEQLISARLIRAEAENRQYLEQGTDLYWPLSDNAAAEIDQVASEVFDFDFQGEQRAAAIGLLESRDFLTAIQGDPGTGKTTALRPVTALYGHKMVGLSVSAAAAEKLKGETGMDTRTVARFLIDAEVRQQALIDGDQGALRRTTYIEDRLRGGAILVDEASMLGSEDAARLCRIAESYQARIILVGDRYQLPGVAAGKPFERWQDLGMQTFHLKEIRRQRSDQERRAVEAITLRDDVTESVKILKKGKNVVELKRESNRFNRITRDYMQRVKSGELHPLLITGTNRVKDVLNHQIRTEMKAAGHLLAIGETHTIKPPKRAEQQREFVAGDRIIFLANDNKGELVSSQAPVKNSQTAILEQVEGGQFRATIIDEDGNRTGQTATWSIEDYQQFDHAYAVSTYKSQGQSVKRHVMYHAPADSPTLNKNDYLVGISRNKNGISIYTDDAQKLVARAERTAHKDEALPLFLRGVEVEQGGSSFVRAVASAAEDRKDREAKLNQQREDLAEKYVSYQDAPRAQRDALSALRDKSRDQFAADIKAARKFQLGETRMSDLEREVSGQLDRWQIHRQDLEEQFRADDSRWAARNHGKRTDLNDGQLAAYAEGVGPQREPLSQETTQTLNEIEMIEQEAIFEAENRQEATEKQDQGREVKMELKEDFRQLAEEAGDQQDQGDDLRDFREMAQEQEQQREEVQEDEWEVYGPR